MKTPSITNLFSILLGVLCACVLVISLTSSSSVIAQNAAPTTHSAATTNSLTQVQVQAILSLLQSFGADADVLAKVSQALGGTATLPPLTTTPPTTATTTVVGLAAPVDGSVHRVGNAIPVSWKATNVPQNSQMVLALKLVQQQLGSTMGVTSGGVWQSQKLNVGSSVGAYSWPTGPGHLDMPGSYQLDAYIKECDPRGCEYNNPDSPTIFRSAKVTRTFTVSVGSNTCPIYQEPVCSVGYHIESGKDANGCKTVPNCVKDIDPIKCPAVAYPQCPIGYRNTAVQPVGGCPVPPVCVKENLLNNTNNTAPTCTIAYSPSTVAIGQSLSVSWSATNATSRSYTLYRSDGSSVFGPSSVSTEGGRTVSSFQDLSAGTYLRKDTVVGVNGTATCSAEIRVTMPLACPAIAYPQCPTGTTNVAVQPPGECPVPPVCMKNLLNTGATSI